MQKIQITEKKKKINNNNVQDMYRQIHCAQKIKWF